MDKEPEMSPMFLWLSHAELLLSKTVAFAIPDVWTQGLGYVDIRHVWPLSINFKSALMGELFFLVDVSCF